ncbi:hypothetical protein B0H19DRAFT_1069890 [Mycena capillaripes]|nr:hypothetical protein B0H19DRAFT_1069890 [Mycena capillaripes]
MRWGTGRARRAAGPVRGAAWARVLRVSNPKRTNPVEFNPSTALHSSPPTDTPAHSPPPRGAPSHPQGARATAVASPVREVHEEQGGSGEQERVCAARKPCIEDLQATLPPNVSDARTSSAPSSLFTAPRSAAPKARMAEALWGGFFSPASACTPSTPATSSVVALAPSHEWLQHNRNERGRPASAHSRAEGCQQLHEDLAAPALNKWHCIQATLHCHGQQNAGNGSGSVCNFTTSTTASGSHEPFFDSPDAYATPMCHVRTKSSLTPSAHAPSGAPSQDRTWERKTRGYRCCTLRADSQAMARTRSFPRTRSFIAHNAPAPSANTIALRKIRSIRDPRLQMRALLRLGNPFLQDRRGRGFVYMHGRVLCDALEDYCADNLTWDELLDLVEIKVGSTNDLVRRVREYRACEEDYILFSWSFFVAPRRMLLASSPGCSESLLVSYNPPRVPQLSHSWWIFCGQGNRQAVQEDDRSINKKLVTKPNGMSGLLAATKAYSPAVAWYFRLAPQSTPPVSHCTPGSILSDSEFSTCTYAGSGSSRAVDADAGRFPLYLSQSRS